MRPLYLKEPCYVPVKGGGKVEWKRGSCERKGSGRCCEGRGSGKGRKIRGEERGVK